jgi:flavorubredoxin
MRQTDDRIIDITGDVKWIGILDYDIRNFDIVMTTEYGTTYNSYFINGWQKALIEVAKEKFSDTYIRKLKELTDPSDLDYIILDHTEPDHSGSLKLLLSMAPEATVVGSGSAIRYLSDMLNIPFKSLIVKDGDSLSLGNKTLRFIAAPNLHWPDTIYTYLEEDKILFTCDSFGAHFCTREMEADMSEAYLRAYKYYFDVILRPFSRFMLKAIERISPLDIKYICPGHGPVLRDNWKELVDLSRKYAEEHVRITGTEARRSILIAYVSAYGYTRMAAELIASAIRETDDFRITLADIEEMSVEELENLIASHDGYLIGSPTINQNTLLPVYKFLAMVNPIRDKGKFAGTFGSYGWSGEAPGIIAAALRSLKLKTFEEDGTFKFLPADEKETRLKEFGRNFALRFSEECAQKK